MVQYDSRACVLEPRARVVHLRNGYSVVEWQVLGKLPLASALEERRCWCNGCNKVLSGSHLLLHGYLAHS